MSPFNSLFQFLIISIVALAPSNCIKLTGTELEAYWKSYKVQHGKRFTFHADDYFRKYAFGRNLNKILEHNTHADLGLKDFKLVLNKFADQTPGEMVKRRTGLDATKLKSASLKLYNPSAKVSTIKTSEGGTSFDWRTYGVVNAPLDQGECGACWAFAAASAVEAQWALSGGELVNASVQQLIDCSWDTGNEGCGGGNMLSAFLYLGEEKFVKAEEYPYLEKDYQCLDKQVETKFGKVGSIGLIDPLNETQLAWAVRELGPVTAAIDAGSPYLMFYWEGIYDDLYCTTSVNHAVTIVGYGTDSKGIDYWIVKNSWGPDWGDNGFFKIRRGVNMCGIAENPIYALL